MKKVIVALYFLVFAVSLTGCVKSNSQEAIKEETYKMVKVLKVQVETRDDIVEYSGLVSSGVQKNLGSKIGGTLESIYVSEGDYVEKGQKLGDIDTKDYVLQLETLDTQIDAALKEVAKVSEVFSFSEKQYESSKVLYEAGAISQLALDGDSMTYNQSKLTVQIAKDNYNRILSEKNRVSEIIGEGTIVADQNGIVDSICFEVSEFVPAGQGVFIMQSRDQEIVIYVTSVEQKILEIDQKINYIVDGLYRQGKIVFIDSIADPQTMTYRVEISIEEDFLLSGILAVVDLVVGQMDGIWIPIQSIQSSTIDFVYVVEDGRAARRTIDILDTKGDSALVLGIEADEEVVVSGMKSLVEGMLIKTEEVVN
jgi:RND family efflux transporter MFP subunit